MKFEIVFMISHSFLISIVTYKINYFYKFVQEYFKIANGNQKMQNTVKMKQ